MLQLDLKMNHPVFQRISFSIHEEETKKMGKEKKKRQYRSTNVNIKGLGILQVCKLTYLACLIPYSKKYIFFWYEKSCVIQVPLYFNTYYRLEASGHTINQVCSLVVLAKPHFKINFPVCKWMWFGSLHLFPMEKSFYNRIPNKALFPCWEHTQN